MNFRWLGIAGLELTFASQSLLIDPCLTRPPFWKLWLGKLQPDPRLLAYHVPRADQILVTHAHYDHLLDVPALAQRSGADVYGSENACRLCRLASVPARQVHRLQTGDRLRLGSFAVQVFPALHRRIPFFRAGALPEGIQPPFTARQYRLDESFSFWVEAGGVSIFDNAGTPPELAVQADLLCLNPFHSLSYCQRLLERVQPKIILPTHWDDFWLPLSKPLRPSYLPPRLGFPPLKRFDPKAFQADLRNLAPQVKVFFPERLEVYSFESLLEG